MTSFEQSLRHAEAEHQETIDNLIELFGLSDDTLSLEQEVETTLSKLAHEFLRDARASTDIELAELARAFSDSRIPVDSTQIDSYINSISTNLIAHSNNTASPRYIGHMTSALPYFVRPLSKLVTAINQNPVKMETAKSFSPHERQVIAMMHRLLFDLPEEFYDLHIHRNESTLGMMSSGGTEANMAALWCARNHKLGPEPGFEGVSREGINATLKHYGFDGAVIIGSELIHYSFDKAGDVLGIGGRNVVRVALDGENRIRLDELRRVVAECKERNLCVLAIIGVAGSTDCGAVDPLEQMAAIAREFGIHFHVDAAWGGALLFSKSHRDILAGIEKADTVTIDGHKQLYLPMGTGLLLIRNPELAKVVEKKANYVIRPGSQDLGKRTWSGSRPAMVLFFHAALNIIGLRGYELLIDEGIRKAKYLAEAVERRPDFELLTRPQMNIMTYRFIPQQLRAKAVSGLLSDDENRFINKVNERLQKAQRQAGKSFVSRTTSFNTRYGVHLPIVGLRAVLANPLTTQADIDAVLEDQLSIGERLSGPLSVTSDLR